VITALLNPLISHRLRCGIRGGEFLVRNSGPAKCRCNRACDSLCSRLPVRCLAETREAYLTESLFDDQSVEILCARCHRTSPKTITWIRVNDRYRCPGCDTEIVIEREKLLRDFQLSRT
jgi:hypothetical protein